MTDILEWWEVRGERRNGGELHAFLNDRLAYVWKEDPPITRFGSVKEARSVRDELNRNHDWAIARVVHVVRRKRGAAWREALIEAAKMVRGRASRARKMQVLGGGMDYACSLAAAIEAESIADEIDRLAKGGA